MYFLPATLIKMRFMSYRKACGPAEVSTKKKNSFNQLLAKFSRITTEDTKNQNIQQKLSKQLLTKFSRIPTVETSN
jgi:hypothetical protein